MKDQTPRLEAEMISFQALELTFLETERAAKSGWESNPLLLAFDPVVKCFILLQKFIIPDPQK